MSGEGIRASLAPSLIKKRQSLIRQNFVTSQTCPFSYSPPGGAAAKDTNTTSISTTLLRKRQSMAEQQAESCPIPHNTRGPGNILKSCNTLPATQEASPLLPLKKIQNLADQTSTTTSATSSSITSRAITASGASNRGNNILKKRQSLDQNTTAVSSSSTPSAALSSSVASSRVTENGKNNLHDSSHLTFSQLSSSNDYFSQVLRVSWNIIGHLKLTNQIFSSLYHYKKTRNPSLPIL